MFATYSEPNMQRVDDYGELSKEKWKHQEWRPAYTAELRDPIALRQNWFVTDGGEVGDRVYEDSQVSADRPMDESRHLLRRAGVIDNNGAPEGGFRDNAVVEEPVYHHKVEVVSQ